MTQRYKREDSSKSNIVPKHVVYSIHSSQRVIGLGYSIPPPHSLIKRTGGFIKISLNNNFYLFVLQYCQCMASAGMRKKLTISSLNIANAKNAITGRTGAIGVPNMRVHTQIIYPGKHQ